MKEEVLIQIRNELKSKQKEIKEYNKKIKRLRNLKKDSKVKEYIELVSDVGSDEKMIKKSVSDIIYSIYRQYIYKISEKETNGIYIYLGTFKYTYEKDIVHGSNDNRVSYNSFNADYRLYWNIECSSAENIPISQCQEFEVENIVLNPKSYFKQQEYYKIQQEFFVKAVNSNQESAKKYILKKYDRLIKK